MKFIFIAVNYNGSFHTKNYLDSLCDVVVPEGSSLEAIIVDNKSSDEDVSSLREIIGQYGFSRLVELDENIGYFKGLNAGIDACMRQANDVLIVGNNDLKFDGDFLNNLKNIEYENDVLVIAPNIITLDGRRQNPHVVVEVPLLEKIKSRIYFSNYYVAQFLRYLNCWIRSVFPRSSKASTDPEPVRMKIKRGIGACYVLTPNFFRFYERLDDRVFLWGEEALLSHQVEIVNGSTLYDPSIKILHCESASVRYIESRRKYDIVKASYQIYREYL